MEHPNVLFVVTDQQRADHTGFMGNSVIQTPNLDAIAARGMVFENAWVSNPICMPNRSTMLTGRMPSAHGVTFNDRSLEWGANTFVRRFRAGGYRTGLLGKSHLQHGMSRNSVVAHRGEPVAWSAHPEGWDRLENAERYLDGDPQDPEDFYGFDHIELAIGHGAYVSGHHLRWALAKGGSLELLNVPSTKEAPGRHRSEEWWQIYQPPYESELHSTSYVAERTVAFIEEAAGQGAPWLAWCSFPDPHHPMTPPGDWFFRHKPEDMELPSTLHDPLKDAPRHLRAFQSRHPRDQRDFVTPCGAGSESLVREAIAATYGMIEMVDDAVGQVLACVERLGQTENTIVVFTSDHGDMMGDHGLFLKGLMHYRGVLQVPLVIDAPGRASGRSPSLASSIDLGPTLLDLCGVDGYDGIQGQPLTPLLDDPAAVVRDHVLIEDDIAPIVSQITGLPSRIRTLVTPTIRYTRNSKREEQLFDLVVDPDEVDDLKSARPELRADAVERLTDALIAAADSARGAPHTE